MANVDGTIVAGGGTSYATRDTSMYLRFTPSVRWRDLDDLPYDYTNVAFAVVKGLVSGQFKVQSSKKKIGCKNLSMLACKT